MRGYKILATEAHGWTRIGKNMVRNSDPCPSVCIRGQNFGARAGVCALVSLAFSSIVAAQPLSVYSEFARIDAKGNVTSPESPREILSPALARNAFATFQVVVQAPENKS